MKVCVIQPPYSANYADSDACFAKVTELLDACDDSLDLIVMPEAVSVPSLAGSKDNMHASVGKYHPVLAEKVRATALRCGATVFYGSYAVLEDGRYYNTVFCCDKSGNTTEVYYKQHLTPGETRKLEFDNGKGYIWEPGWPACVTVDGVKYAFLVCYDFYFYESFPVLARLKPDVIIGCSHQRSDLHSALETSCKFLAYNTNAYVVRASVSMGEESELGGCSLVATPRGDILVNAESRVGLFRAEFDPSEKYLKPMGYGGKTGSHAEYVDRGRKPWKYRPAGPAIVPNDVQMPYPRICAHRGFNTVAPENSMPAFAAAIALGAREIEFDLWETSDGEIVSIHDKKLDRTSDGEGYVFDHTYGELLRLDFGAKYGEKFRGLKILKFEDILQKFSCQVIMNVHVKPHTKTEPEDPEKLRKIVDLVRKYDCEKYVYFMCGNDTVMAQLRDIAPDIARCMGGGNDPWHIVERGIALGCSKVQFVHGKFNAEMVDAAHAAGMKTTVFYADDVATAREYLDMGVDTILTNDYLALSTALGIR